MGWPCFGRHRAERGPLGPCALLLVFDRRRQVLILMPPCDAARRRSASRVSSWPDMIAGPCDGSKPFIAPSSRVPAWSGFRTERAATAATCSSATASWRQTLPYRSNARAGALLISRSETFPSDGVPPEQGHHVKVAPGFPGLTAQVSSGRWLARSSSPGSDRLCERAIRRPRPRMSGRRKRRVPGDLRSRRWE